MSRFAFVSALLGWLLVPLCSSAGEPDPLPDRLQRFYTGAATLTGRFEQQVVDEPGTQRRPQTGRFWIARPGGRYRWEYEEPFPQLIVSNGETIWVYDEELEQVTVRDITQADAALPAALLAEGTRLSTLFDVAVSPDDPDVILLQPLTEDAGFETLTLTFEDDSLASLTLRDTLGRNTRFRFFDVERNRPVGERRFQFEPPGGVDILRN